MQDLILKNTRNDTEVELPDDAVSLHSYLNAIFEAMLEQGKLELSPIQMVLEKIVES